MHFARFVLDLRLVSNEAEPGVSASPGVEGGRGVRKKKFLEIGQHVRSMEINQLEYSIMLMYAHTVLCKCRNKM